MRDEPWSNLDRSFMARALALARRGIGLVEPNPAVGAVLVRRNRIIGQGYHRFFGAPHAEVAALAGARSNGRTAKGAILYVTLEPCCHWGKTPPCTEAVIAAGITRVVAATPDPSAKVAGKGFAALKHAGIDVRVGLLASEARQLNPWFFKFHGEQRPWVIAKWAQTLDGRLAARTGRSKWISSAASRQEAHRLRRSCQAVVVGVGTVLADDPQLTVRLEDDPRLPAGPPNRVILDSRLRVPLSSRLVQTARSIPTWIITSRSASRSRARALEDQGIHVVAVAANSRGEINLKAFLRLAARQGWARIMVEGGAWLLSSFIQAGLADELVVFQAPSLALDGRAVTLTGRQTRDAGDFLRRYRLQSVSRAEEDLILRFWQDGQASTLQASQYRKTGKQGLIPAAKR